MRDKDTILLEQLVESKYDSLFSGKLEEDDGDTSLGSDDKDDDKKDDDDSSDSDDNSSDDDKKDDDSDSDSDDNPFKKKDSDSDSDDSDDSDDDDSDGSKSGGGDSGIQSKVKQLQKQYNDLLVDAFEKYAAECIENALDGVESSFGEDIQDILDGALDELKGKILGDLGVEASNDLPMVPGAEGGIGDIGGDEGGGMEMEIGGEPEVTFGSPVGGVPTTSSVSDDDEKIEEEGHRIKLGKRKIIKESTKMATFYGFV